MRKKKNDENHTFDAAIGRQLRLLRRVRNVTQKEAAGLLSAKPMMMSKIESGHSGISLYNAAILAKYYDVDLDKLIQCAKDDAPTDKSLSVYYSSNDSNR